MFTYFLYVCQSFSWLTSLLKFGHFRAISCSGWYIVFLIFLETFLGCLYTISKYWKFLYVCQSVIWLNFLLKLDKYRGISWSVWYISLKFFEDISGIFVQYLQMFANFFYFCQYVSWLTSLLILGHYRNISSSGWYIFWNLLEPFLGCLYTISK